MNNKKIKEICDITMGQSPKSIFYNSEGIGLPFYQGKADFGDIHPTPSKYCSKPLRIAEKDDILMSVRAPVGDVNIAQEKSCIGRGVSAIRPKEGLHYKYLYYVLTSMKERIAFLGTGSTFKAINKKQLENIEIPVPSLKVQQEAIELFDLLNAVIDKRQQQIEALSSLKQSIFLDMFGEPKINNNSFEEIKVKDITLSLKAGLSTGGEDREREDGEYGVLTTSAVTYGIFDPTCYKVPKKERVLDRKLVFPTKNSILVSRMNTRELVGAACIVESDYPDLFLPDRLWKLELNEEYINPYYFISAVQTTYFQSEISRISTGTSGSMLNISQKKYLNMKMPLPPKNLQDKYEDIVKKINAKLKLLENSKHYLEQLLNALSQKAFNGELFQDDQDETTNLA